MSGVFVVAKNPDPHSRLGYLLRLPIDDGLTLKAREPWPTTSRVFCAEAGEWPQEAEVIETLPVRSCRRRGVAIDLVLERSRLNRSQFVFTNLKGGRPAIFWQTPKTTRNTKPGARVPKRRASGQRDLVITVDSREKYGYRFAGKQAVIEKDLLRCGDYAVLGDDGVILAAVERKSLANLSASLVDGSIQFVLADLAELPKAAVVIESGYADLLDLKHVQPGFVLDLLARLQVRFSNVPLVFAGSRKFAEEYTYRFLGAARADLGDD
ncbi:MAG: ERCC4 domain-containing protein [Actinomycetota bacterium]